MLLKFVMLLFLSAPFQHHVQARTSQSEFLSMINSGRMLDPYHPKTSQGLFVGGIQNGLHSQYTNDDPADLYGRYYLSKEFRVHAYLPQINMDQLTLGAEYDIGRILGDRNWLGLDLTLESSEFSPYFRGIYFLSRVTKAYYEGRLAFGDNGTLVPLHLGIFSKPFSSSRNTYIDTRLSFNHFNGDDFTSQQFNVKGEFGHRWAGFNGIRELELYGALGMEYARYSFSSNGFSSNDSDSQITILIGALYRTILR